MYIIILLVVVIQAQSMCENKGNCSLTYSNCLTQRLFIYLLRYTDVGQDVLENRKISVAAGNRNPDLQAYSLANIPTDLSRLPSVISTECSWLNDSKSILIFTFDDRNERDNVVRGRSNFVGGRGDNTTKPFFVKGRWM